VNVCESLAISDTKIYDYGEVNHIQKYLSTEDYDKSSMHVVVLVVRLRIIRSRFKGTR